MTESAISVMDIERIMQLLPHRYPLLLVDRVLSVDPGQSIHAIKNVTVNEPFFEGHFPHFRVMPGVLILEALAQTSALMTFADPKAERHDDDVYFFASIDGARFKKPVVPGDQLHLYAELRRFIRGIWRYQTVAKVDNQVVAEATLMCTVKAK